MKDALVDAVADLDETTVLDIVKDMMDKNEDILIIQHKLVQGLDIVGQRYASGQYYIADLMVAGELIKNVMKIKGMAFSKKIKGPAIGKIVVGTVFEDIHDVGKDILVSMLRSAGFHTIDLGVDVSSKRFIEAIKTEKPDIVGISGVLSMVGDNIKDVIDDITNAGIRDNVLIIVGGAAMNDKLFETIDADAFSKDAAEGVNICVNWVKQKNR